MEHFKGRAREVLLNEYDLEYENALDLPGAYKALKGILKNPPVVHSKRPLANYMKMTFSTSRHAVPGRVDERRYIELSKMTSK